MKIQMMAPEDIQPYWNNPRDNKKAVDVVARSLQQFGFRQPIVVDSEKVIVVGHTRWLASKKLNIKEIPVHIAHDLTADQIKAYRIADNKTNEHASWDDSKLMQELEGLASAFPDLTALGFTDAEIKEMNEPDTVDLDALASEFEVPPMEGEFWILLRAPESDCAAILAAIKKMKVGSMHLEYSGDSKINSKDQKK